MTEAQIPAPTFPSRRHDLDWLRIGAFVLLIFYHVGMFYVSWDWHVKSAHAGPASEPLMMLVNPWRLSLLFFISGVAFAYLLHKRGPVKFATERAARLLPVILFGMLVIVMPQTYFQLREMGEIGPGILAFWPRYITAWEIADIVVPTWNHLWYVVYLFVYAGIVAVLWPGIKQIGRLFGPVLGALWSSRAGPMLLLLIPVLPFLAYRIWLVPHFETTHNLTSDWANHAISFTMLLFGVWAARAEAFWRSVDRALPYALVGILFLGSTLSIAWANWDTVSQDILITWVARAGRVAYAWIVIVALLGLARRFFTGDGPVRRYLTEAVFPVYILHQTITVSAGYGLSELELGAWPEFIALTTITFAGSFAGFELVRRVSWLRPLFGLKGGVKRKTPAAETAGG